MKISISAFNILVLSTTLSMAAAGNLRTEADTRIAGGSDADVGQFPYYVDLEKCGGTLISPTVVLTAGHCDCKQEPNCYVGRSVLVGANEVHKEILGAEWIRVVEQVIHPSYTSDYENDVMLLRLEKPYYLANQFKLNLADYSTENLVGGDLLTALGLGYLSEYIKESPDWLQHVEIPIIDYDTCTDADHYGGTEDYYDGYVIEEQSFCAGSEGQNSCKGDSGGPIVRVEGNNEHTLVGLVSWSGGFCTDVRKPVVYMRVAAYHDWIKSVTCDSWGTEGGLCGGNPQGSNSDDDIENCVSVEVNVSTDHVSEDTQIIVKQDKKTIMNQKGFFDVYTDYNVRKCLDPEACIKVIIKDASENGLSASAGGHAEIKFNGEQVYSGNKFGKKVTRKHNC